MKLSLCVKISSKRRNTYKPQALCITPHDHSCHHRWTQEVALTEQLGILADEPFARRGLERCAGVDLAGDKMMM